MFCMSMRQYLVMKNFYTVYGTRTSTGTYSVLNYYTKALPYSTSTSTAVRLPPCALIYGSGRSESTMIMKEILYRTVIIISLPDEIL